MTRKMDEPDEVKLARLVLKSMNHRLKSIRFMALQEAEVLAYFILAKHSMGNEE